MYVDVGVFVTSAVSHSHVERSSVTTAASCNARAREKINKYRQFVHGPNQLVPAVFETHDRMHGSPLNLLRLLVEASAVHSPYSVSEIPSVLAGKKDAALFHLSSRVSVLCRRRITREHMEANPRSRWLDARLVFQHWCSDELRAVAIAAAACVSSLFHSCIPP